MTDTLRVNELEDNELRQQFNSLVEAMVDQQFREEGAHEALNQLIIQAVTDKPELAQLVSERQCQSLLLLACYYLNLDLDTSHDAIKCLIQAFPSALLGILDDRNFDQDIYILNARVIDARVPICIIARHTRQCALLPWIASNYPWILDGERCRPVALGLLETYARRGRSSCTASILKDFFEAYPRAFTQLYSDGNVLHKLLRQYTYDYRRIEPEVDLFKWVVEHCPNNYLFETDSNGYTLLHLACISLSKHKGPDSSEICKYLIDKFPASVRMFNDNRGDLPIHILQASCEYRLVREVVVSLLREYPESFNIRSRCRGWKNPPSTLPFPQIIKPYLGEEKELKEAIASLKDSTSSLTEAVTCTNDTLVRSASTIFDSWATSFINTTEDKLGSILVKLQDMCNEGIDSDE